MIAAGYVVDVLTGEPVDASLTIINKQGEPLGPHQETNTDGYFEIDSPLLMDNDVLVSSVAYTSVIVPASILDPRDPPEIGLYQDYDQQDPVIVTPKKRYALLVVLGLIVLAVVSKN